VEGPNTKQNNLKLLTYFVIFMFLLTFLFLSNSNYEKALALTNFRTYENSTYGVRIDYPWNWEKKEGISQNNIVAFRPPTSDILPGAPDSYYDNATGLGIYVQNLSSLLSYEGMTLDTYTNLQLGHLGPDDSVINIENFTLGNYPAYKVMTANSFITTQVWTIKNNQAYVIIYISSNISTYDRDSSAIETMINSFKFTK
jgi:hypothetical protein